MYAVWSLVMVRNWLTSRDVENFFSPKIATFSQFQVRLNVAQAKQMISSLLLSNFYPVISYRRVQKESDELSCTARSLVMVREPVARR